MLLQKAPLKAFLNPAKKDLFMYVTVLWMTVQDLRISGPGCPYLSCRAKASTFALLPLQLIETSRPIGSKKTYCGQPASVTQGGETPSATPSRKLGYLVPVLLKKNSRKASRSCALSNTKVYDWGDCWQHLPEIAEGKA